MYHACFAGLLTIIWEIFSSIIWAIFWAILGDFLILLNCQPGFQKGPCWHTTYTSSTPTPTTGVTRSPSDPSASWTAGRGSSLCPSGWERGFAWGSHWRGTSSSYSRLSSCRTSRLDWPSVTRGPTRKSGCLASPECHCLFTSIFHWGSKWVYGGICCFSVTCTVSIMSFTYCPY